MKRILMVLLALVLAVSVVTCAEETAEKDFTISWDDVTMNCELTADVKIDTENGEWKLWFDSAYGPYQLGGYYTEENGGLEMGVTDDGGLGQFIDATWSGIEPQLRKGLTAFLFRPDFNIAWNDVTMATELNGGVKIDRANGEWTLRFDSAYGPYQLAGYYTAENGELDMGVTDDGGLGRFIDATWSGIEPQLREGLTAYLNRPDFSISWNDVTMACELFGDVKIHPADEEWVLNFNSSYGPYELKGFYTEASGELTMGVTDDGGLGQFIDATWSGIEPELRKGLTAYLADSAPAANAQAEAKRVQVTFHYGMDGYEDETVEAKAGLRMVQVEELAFRHVSKYHKGQWFVSWYMNSERTAPVVSGEKLSDNVELFAAWRQNFEGLEAMDNSPIAGRRIAVLGSSVFAADEAVGEYLAIRFDTELIKEAIPATTLCDINKESYVSRIANIDPNAAIDLFVCQLSTNDATRGLEIGAVSESTSIEDFDTQTVTGALEYIIAYVRKTWNCPMMIMTGSQYDSEAYAKMVDIVAELQAKWGIGVIDLWHNDEVNGISDDLRVEYIAADGIHPTALGYRVWWGPAMEQAVLEYLAK